MRRTIFLVKESTRILKRRQLTKKKPYLGVFCVEIAKFVTSHLIGSDIFQDKNNLCSNFLSFRVPNKPHKFNFRSVPVVDKLDKDVAGAAATKKKNYLNIFNLINIYSVPKAY